VSVESDPGVGKNVKNGKKCEYILKRHETGQINHLPELGEIIHTLLNLLKTISNAVALESDLEKSVAHRPFKEKKVGHGAIELATVP
jgi:hypothetical protein